MVSKYKVFTMSIVHHEYRARVVATYFEIWRITSILELRVNMENSLTIFPKVVFSRHKCILPNTGKSDMCVRSNMLPD